LRVRHSRRQRIRLGIGIGTRQQEACGEHHFVYHWAFETLLLLFSSPVATDQDDVRGSPCRGKIPRQFTQ
jgi:hypothetical protein